MRVIDALAVSKDADGNVKRLHESQLSDQEQAAFGALVGVLAEIPEDSAAALILLEHRWAIPLRDAIARPGGVRLASEFISPLDLAALGLVTAEEAEALATRACFRSWSVS